MPDPNASPPSPRAGGCLVAAGLVIGPIAGMAIGQPSLGLLAGGLVGAVAAVVIALLDRR